MRAATATTPAYSGQGVSRWPDPAVDSRAPTSVTATVQTSARPRKRPAPVLLARARSADASSPTVGR
ncbi:hypothetical protein ACH4Q6_17150 [Streptomyces lydicus]|uniref:hypothetical protein n=1 Tax=Streptomyces lydicus TaxID=47763 RepID=UPI0037AE2453